MAENRCEPCNRDFDSKEALEQHSSVKHFVSEKKSFNWKRYGIFAIMGLILVFSVLSVSSYMQKPGQYDDFAQCLSEKGAVVYGNNFCSYTGTQLGLFGKSKEHLNYVKCIDNEELCNSKGVSITPTWEIDGKTYSGVQSFKTLSSITGCQI